MPIANVHIHKTYIQTPCICVQQPETKLYAHLWVIFSALVIIYTQSRCGTIHGTLDTCDRNSSDNSY